MRREQDGRTEQEDGDVMHESTDNKGTTRYPLAWPVGQPRTPESRRENAAFKVDFRRARDETIHSLNLLGARNVILSSNVPLRHDGLPYANVAEPRDPGVAVYFERRIASEWRSFVIACDSRRLPRAGDAASPRSRRRRVANGSDQSSARCRAAEPRKDGACPEGDLKR